MSKKTHNRLWLCFACILLIAGLVLAVAPAMSSNQDIPDGAGCTVATDHKNYSDCVDSSSAPEPLTILIFGTVLTGFGLVVRRQILH